MQVDVYTILCFTEMSLTRADILPAFIFFTSPHEHSADIIPIILKLPYNLQNQGLWFMVNSVFDNTDDHYLHNYLYYPSYISYCQKDHSYY